MKPSCLYFHVILAAYYAVQAGSKDLNVKSMVKRLTCGHVRKATSLQSNAPTIIQHGQANIICSTLYQNPGHILILHTNGKLRATGIHSAKRNLKYFLYIFKFFTQSRHFRVAFSRV